jgi:hypothetical protein
MHEPSLDPVAVLVLLSALLFSPRVAAVVGPYLVIVMGASLGAFWRLRQRNRDERRDSRASALTFFVAVNVGALLFTASAALIAQRYVPLISDESILFAPIAFGIGIIGERWPAIGQWAAAKFNRATDAYIRLRAGNSGDSDGTNH